ncbi:hypothetical protein RRF57_007296 [Xylaria bambusicola]|uniref:Uncharacterized protein n=1 Tax=Xylaria bambusicola TaxID=326684 RepID=A0AAN7Z7G1_9PEZI
MRPPRILGRGRFSTATRRLLAVHLPRPGRPLSATRGKATGDKEQRASAGEDFCMTTHCGHFPLGHLQLPLFTGPGTKYERADDQSTPDPHWRYHGVGSGDSEDWTVMLQLQRLEYESATLETMNYLRHISPLTLLTSSQDKKPRGECGLQQPGDENQNRHCHGGLWVMPSIVSSVSKVELQWPDVTTIQSISPSTQRCSNTTAAQYDQ